MQKKQDVYCRYHLVSPFCMGRSRPLRSEEMTLEHLIPKTKMRQGNFRDRYRLKGIGTSSPENTDITCQRCNHFKKNAADLEFVWKLRYCARYGLDLQSKSRLLKSLLQASDTSAKTALSTEDWSRIAHTVLFGECHIKGDSAFMALGKNRITLESGRLRTYQRGNRTIYATADD